ncbi:MAG TPA: hypothetical protein VGS41_09745, partial [Chthonomonadales bacterium]|nr:hypothetical protein [Chthonomonadales bacterium]
MGTASTDKATVEHLRLEAARPGANRGRVPAAPEFQLWLASDGAISGYWYSSRLSRFGPASAEAGSLPFHYEGGIRRLFAAARYPSKAPPGRFDARAIGQSPEPPPDLRLLCDGSSPIVEGVVAGVPDVYHLPANTTFPEQSTEVAFAVE